MTLIYHTFFAEYRGNTPQELIASIHREAKSGTGQSFEDWWSYQQKLWSHLYGISVPDAHAPNANDDLLTILVKVRALEKGSAPQHVAKSSRFKHG